MLGLANVRAKIFTIDRVPALDYWRAIAILSVLVGHFFDFRVNFGLIGVQIFFVLSGFLVSRTLIEAYFEGTSLPLKKFWLARFWRIVPSYFFFLIFGSLFAYLLFGDENGILIPQEYAWSYWLFLKNYNYSNPKAFAHVWTLCVEEHFYLLLPFLFLALATITLTLTNTRKAALLIGVLMCGLGVGLLVRYLCAYEYVRTSWFGASDPAATHNNLDCLLYGVLLRTLDCQGWRLQGLGKFFAGLIGSSLVAISMFYDANPANVAFHLIYAKTLLCLGFMLLLWATLTFSARILSSLRWLSFYSYNWYLWHMIALLLVRDTFGPSATLFPMFVIVSLLMAMTTTHLIEFPAYRVRTLLQIRRQPSPSTT